MNTFLICTFGLLTILFSVLTVIFCQYEKEKPELVCLVLMVLLGGLTIFFTTPGVN